MEDDQQFCLRWNNHQSTLVAVFDTLLENGTLVDCTLAAEGKYLNAHKVVLSACSPYFESLLSQNYDKHPIFILKDVKYQELKAMMDYMYRGEVNISQDQLGALLKAAESLQIKGLSDNRKGETETKKTVAPPPPPPVSKSPPPTSASIPRVQGLTIEQRRREMEESREGSQSPGARKRKRIRRRSLEDIENHHDASNSSESHHSSSHAPAQNIPTALSAAAAVPIKVAPPSSTDVPEPVESKSEILTRHKPPTAVVAAAAGDPEITQVPTKEKLETHSELMLEPKAEYIDEMNEDSIEDLTLDDDDISNMEQMDDSGAGPSHGNLGEASGQGFGGWHMGNQSQDEVFLAAQEAVGAHRDSQGSSEEALRLMLTKPGGECSKLVEELSVCSEKPFQPGYHSCDVCGAQYRNVANLLQHQTSENHVTRPGAKKYVDLDKIVVWVMEHKNYLSVFDDTQIYCKLCDKVFQCVQKSNITRHLKTKLHKYQMNMKNKKKPNILKRQKTDDEVAGPSGRKHKVDSGILTKWLMEYQEYMSVIDDTQIYCKLCDHVFRCYAKPNLFTHLKSKTHKYYLKYNYK